MSAPSFVLSKYPEMQAGGFDRYDGTIHFYSRVNSLLESKFTVLDFGAGRGKAHVDHSLSEYRKRLALLRGKVTEVIGADVDDVVLTNPGIDRAIVLDSGKIPLPDGSIDLILSDWTFEHIPDPALTAAELDRVLKPGGWLCARTPNRNGYIALFNRIVPDRMKARVLNGAQPTRKSEDVFPALYLLNDFGSLRQHFPESRFEHASYTWDATPAYHFGRRWIYSTFTALHYVSPPLFRTVLMVFIRKRN